MCVEPQIPWAGKLPARPSRLRGLRPSAISTTASASWRSGYAADCKSVYTGSIPVLASTTFFPHFCQYLKTLGVYLGGSEGRSLCRKDRLYASRGMTTPSQILILPRRNVAWRPPTPENQPKWRFLSSIHGDCDRFKGPALLPPVLQVHKTQHWTKAPASEDAASQISDCAGAPHPSRPDYVSRRH